MIMRKVLIGIVLSFSLFIKAQDISFFAVDSTSGGGSGPSDGFLWTNNLIARYDFNTAGSNDGDPIGFVTDLTTNHFDLNSSGSNRPYYTNDVSAGPSTNGWAVWVAANTSWLRTNSSTTFSQPITYIAVARAWGGADNSTLVSSKSGVNCSFVVGVGGVATEGIYAGTPLSTAIQTAQHAFWNTIILKFNGASSQYRFATNKPAGGFGNAGSASFNPIVLGVRDTSSFPANMEVAYFLAYNEDVSDSNLTNICGWMADKFGTPRFLLNP